MNFSSSKLVRTHLNDAEETLVPIDLSDNTLVLRKKASFPKLLQIAVSYEDEEPELRGMFFISNISIIEFSFKSKNEADFMFS